MSYEQQALELIAENKALKAQVNALRGALDFMMQRPFDEDDYVNMVRQCSAILDLTFLQCLNGVKASAAIELAGIFHDGQWRSDTAMLICEEYANKLRSKQP